MPHRPTVMDALEGRTCFDSLTAGVTVPTAVTTARPNKNWSIHLTAGQAVYLAAGETTASAFQTQLILITPNHKAIARSVGDSGAFVSKVAPVTGTYIVRVRDTSGTNSSPVQVTAFFTGSTPVADGDDAGTMQSGRRFAASIAPGDLDVWRINATGNQFLSVVANENSPGGAVGVGVALIGPDGTGVTAKEDEAGFALDDPAKSKSGVYYAVAYEPGANASGRYGISLGLTPGVQTTEDPDTQSPLVAGTPRNGDLPSGDIDLFQVSVAKGQTINLTAARTGGTTTPAILLIDPDGNVVKTASGATSANLSYVTAKSGTFSFLLRNRDPSTGGAYRLTYANTVVVVD